MKKNILLILFVAIVHFSYAQIREVGYSIKYNPETCLFDCYLDIVEGNATAAKDRIQFNSQYTVVVPSGSDVQIEKRHMPLQKNKDYLGFSPTMWEVTSITQAPAMRRESDYYSITPPLIPTSFYNDLKKGEQVKLFSLKISPVVDCGSSIKLYENGVDLNSRNVGMVGSDFRNGFTIGGVTQKYSGNRSFVLPTAPSIGKVDIKKGNTIQVSAPVTFTGSNCQTKLDYEWYDPKGLISTDKEFPSLSSKDIQRGEYKLVVIDDLGCRDEVKFRLIPQSDSEEIINGVVDELNNEFTVSIFPNPTTDVINLNVNGKVGTPIQVNIYDLNGKIIKSKVLDTKLSNSSEEFKIPTNLQTGIYSLGVKSESDKIVYHKLIIFE